MDSVVYSSGLALRFPRVERIRYDKPCSEVLSKAEVYRIKENFRSGWREMGCRGGSLYNVLG